MKKLVKYAAFLLILGLTTLYSCDPNDVINPDEDVRAPYLGTWLCTELSGMSYSVTVSLDQTNSAQILIGNFHLYGASEKVYAIATTNNLTLPSQLICGNTVHGSGNLINANKFTMKYYVNDQTTIDTVNADYTK
ncbi:MAG TPA: hypothetical protein PLB59_02545 [Bacteroidales bacterium]|nr:hypothetical protein [Bacteroidales bacterium]HPB25195.1 hypothetical protein [Bacteroidales bacterium]HPI30225.1 hypothetical protein [Bacteroidales bacterium]HQN15530.1 hypothetical protein [Bacteroidales bacterium]HQP14822.1 hypothetical protein [Bacteroidales bacterium]